MSSCFTFAIIALVKDMDGFHLSSPKISSYLFDCQQCLAQLVISTYLELFFFGFQNSIPSYCFSHLSCCFSLFPLLLLTSEDLISQDSALDSILFFVNRKHLGFSSSLIHSYGFNTLYMPTPKFNAPVLTSVLNFKQFLFVIGISNAYLILNMSQIKSLTLPSILLLLSSSLVQ